MYDFIFKRILFLGVCLGIVMLICQSSWAAPRIKFEETTFDVGRILQGKAAMHTFTFHNAGDQSLIIKDVRAG